MKTLLREPFVHFIVLGLGLFAAHGVWQKQIQKSERTIIVNPAEMERQAQIFAAENRRQPSDNDLEGLLFAHIEEQVLMREAIRLGLNEDDTIIRRRLAQKMRFMIDDVSMPALPDRTALETWFNENPSRFAVQRDFGTAFAQALFALPRSDAWQGPINSAFGVHLVRLTDVTPAYLPDFEDIQIEVEAVWLDEAKRAENAKALEDLIAKYKVEVEE